MTITRQWQHSVAYDADGTGVAWDSVSVAGNHVVSGGGFAEPITYSGSGDSSTSTSQSAARGMMPIVGMYSEYNSGANTTYFYVGFAVSPGWKCRAHIYAQWEA